jgi:hypothetical protein
VGTKWRARPTLLVPLIGGAVIAVIAIGAYLASPLIIRTRATEPSPFAGTAAFSPTASARIAEPGTGALTPLPSANEVNVETVTEAPAAATRGGSFADRDQIHRGSGQVILGQTAQGTTVLRFESFSVTNGPDLHVFLSRSARPVSHDEVYDGVYVGKLKASEGAFNYELPPGTDLAAMRSVVVYCVPFRVIFTSAPLG